MMSLFDRNLLHRDLPLTPHDLSSEPEVCAFLSLARANPVSVWVLEVTAPRPKRHRSTTASLCAILAS